MKRVSLVYFNAGGGHLAAAHALRQTIERRGLPWQVRMIDLFAVLDPQQLFSRLTGVAPEAFYNMRLARGWTLGMTQELKLLQRLIRLSNPTLVARLARFWAAEPPDLVVSLVPNFNRALGESLARACPGVPFLTVLTDLADHPPNFWIEPDVEQVVICGTDRATEQARASGVPEARIRQVSGMMLRPDFHEPPAGCREASRHALGLDPGQTTGIVMFGGHGSAIMLRIARELPDTPLILMCGRNERLARRLRETRARAQRLVVEFTPDVARLMRAADFLIGKPGPGSVSEALQCGLPVIVANNSWTMPQERFNASWIARHQVGLVIDRFSRISGAVQRMKQDLDGFRERVSRLENRAVFEVCDILGEYLDPGGVAGLPERKAA
jgi:UDP-N-acetylglucosamine:LPS N-acetylglucosamine transferase